MAPTRAGATLNYYNLPFWISDMPICLYQQGIKRRIWLLQQNQKHSGLLRRLMLHLSPVD
jgi:hypothetical protein